MWCFEPWEWDSLDLNYLNLNLYFRACQCTYRKACMQFDFIKISQIYCETFAEQVPCRFLICFSHKITKTEGGGTPFVWVTRVTWPQFVPCAVMVSHGLLHPPNIVSRICSFIIWFFNQSLVGGLCWWFNRICIYIYLYIYIYVFLR